MSSQSFSRPGAFDLSALNTAPPTAPGNRDAVSAGGAGNGGYVIEVTEASFQVDVLQQSMTVPVVIDFWATWCEPCKQLSPILERLATEYDGRFVLATIDVDANQALAQSAQVQSIPTVMAVLRGQAVPLFQGALPEADVRRFIDELLKVAVANDVTGRAEATSGSAEAQAEPEEEPIDPRFEAAYDAINAGDFDAAAAAYQQVLAESPADAEAKAGLAQVGLLRRTAGVDDAAARRAADENPADVDAQLQVADLDIVGGKVEAAFDRLIDMVRKVAGDDRDRVRSRIVELFEVVGPADPRVTKARAALASALF